MKKQAIFPKIPENLPSRTKPAGYNLTVSGFHVRIYLKTGELLLRGGSTSTHPGWETGRT